MGQIYSLDSAFRTRKSIGNTFAQDFAAVVKLIKSSPLSDDILLTTPKTSAHKAFRNYIDPQKKKKEAMSKHIGTMSNLFNIGFIDADNIQQFWPKIEKYLLPIGIRVFISMLESRCEKIPACKKACCNGRDSSKSQPCPNQIILNEELQKFVLLLMGLMRRTVKHINNQASVLKLLHKVSRKHFSKLNLDITKIDHEAIGVHFSNAIRDIIIHTTAFTPDVEGSYSFLIRTLVVAMQRLALTPPPEHEGDTNSDEEDPDEPIDILIHSNNGAILSRPFNGAPFRGSLGSMGPNPSISNESGTIRKQQALAKRTPKSARFSSIASSSNPITNVYPKFDKTLLEYGCQTFQDFFEMNPDLLCQFDQYHVIKLDENVNVADALKMHTSKILALVEDIASNSDNPANIMSLLKDLGKHHNEQGITEEHLDMMGPIICHTIRPVVFKAGLWSIEVEKSWNHLFEMLAILMKKGFPQASQRSLIYMNNFPNLTHIIILKDTWASIANQMHELGLTSVVKLFKINYNLRFYSSPKVRYRPVKMHEDTEHLSLLFNLLVSIIDHIVNGFPNSSSGDLGEVFTSPATKKNMAMLKEPMEWLGPVFCNTVRPLLLVQGKWSYQVELSWRLMFKHLMKRHPGAERRQREADEADHRRF